MNPFSPTPEWPDLLWYIVVPAAAALLAHSPFRRVLPPDNLIAYHNVAGFLVAVVGVLYAVVLGFLVVTVWTGALLPPSPSPSPSSTAVPSGAEIPYQADSLVDSIGMNTHFQIGGFYQTAFSTLKVDLISLGIRHIRDGNSSANSTIYSEFSQLGTAGIHLNNITSLGQSAAYLQSLPAAISPALESYEDPNEVDNGNSPNWLANIKAFMPLLYNAVHPLGYPVIGPALTQPPDWMSLGNQSAYMDYGNMHNYFAGFFPGIIGWGGTVNGCGPFNAGGIDFNLYCASNASGPLTFSQSLVRSGFDSYVPQSGAKRIMATESGYGDTQTQDPGTKANTVDSTTQGKYVPRLFLMHYASGVPRTYWYDLVDNAADGYFQYFGTLTSSYTPKPSFYALQGLISTLSDPGASFSTTPLVYSFSGGPSSRAHMLFQKRSGQYVLAVWNESSSWNPNINGGCGRNCGGPVTVTPQSVTIHLPFAPSGLRVKAFNNAGNLATVTPSVSGNNVTLSIDDHVTLASFSHP